MVQTVPGGGGGGPTQGQGLGSKKNTFANILSKSQIDYTNPGGMSALPPLDPASTANYYSQLAGLYAGYQNQLQGLKLQRIGAKADFRDAAAGIRAQKIGDLASVENQQIERGLLGSSADLQQRTGVRAGAAAAIQTAKREKLMTIAGTRLEGQAAGINYFMGVQGLEAQKLAQQQTLLAQQLQQNLIVSGQESSMDVLQAIYESLTGGGGYGGGGGGSVFSGGGAYGGGGGNGFKRR